MAVNIKKYSVRIVLCTLIVAQWVAFGANIPVPQPSSAESVTQNLADSLSADTLKISKSDSTSHIIDSLALSVADSVHLDSTAKKKSRPFLDDVVTGSNKDSLVYDVKSGKIYAYRNADITYQGLNIKADYLEMDMQSKLIYAHGIPNDTTGKPTRPVFKESGTDYTMDTITYDIATKKALIKGIVTKEGEGIMYGARVKKMPDNTINVAGGRYTTCDADHPHYYINMTEAKVMPGKKVAFGPSYFVMEDVPLYFLGLPFGFFPLATDRSSGFIMPSYGEQATLGFFLRDGGYYFAPNDFIDGAATASIYTLGSWDATLRSRYIKRYKYTGNANFNYSKIVSGDRGSTDFQNQSNYRIMWSHSQDPKFRPNSTFSANVNFATSGYNKYSSNNVNDYINTQINSSIAYSKNWTDKPMSFSANFSHSQNNRDSTYTFGFPAFSFNVSRLTPFKRKDALGKQQWYEKVSLTYNTTFTNSFTVKEYDLFTPKMYESMKNGMNHTIPVTTQIGLFNYINITPSFNYNERWYFDKITKAWDPEKNVVEVTDTTRGFYRVFNYSYAASFTTRVYGMYQFKKGSAVQAIRHVMTPTASFSYTPDFSQEKFGYYRAIQVDSTGRMGTYSPFERGIYGVPGSGRSAALSFGLNNNLEMKVRSKSDSLGFKKVIVLDNLGASGSYNFLADSLNFSQIGVNLRSSVIKDFGINLSMVYDLYQVDKRGYRINRFLIEKGQLARLVSVGTAFGYNFSGGSGKKSNAVNSGNNGLMGSSVNPFLSNPGEPLDPTAQRAMMASSYYDFSIPYNVGFNYNIQYQNNGIKKQITQTLGFNSSVNLTSKWAITYSGGYDFGAKKMTIGQFVLTRDLHCWQMNFNWIPTGFIQSWSFNISIKSSMLKDLKYDKSSSFYDNFFDQ